jgi:uncharacterized protein involved in type VI secretion and phage assembly
VLGSLWNGKNRPPETNADRKNAKRHIKTPAGHSLTFDDSKGAETITIHHKSGAQVVLEANGGITITAKGNLAISADGDITMTANKGQGAVTVKAKTMDVTGP